MLYRNLGRTGPRISEIGFGCGNVGGLMVRGSHEDQVRAVEGALERGINYFDTAGGYGDGKSESNLGQVLEELRAGVVLATKVRLGPESLPDIKAATILSAEQSLNRLRRDEVDLIQLHTRSGVQRNKARFCLTPSEVAGPKGVLEAFRVLKEQGKARYCGFSGLGDPAEALHALIDSGEFNSVQAYYNLLNPSAGQPVPRGFSALDYKLLIDRAAARGMAAVVIRVLAAGVLSGTPEQGGGSGSEALSPGSDTRSDIERARQLGFLITGGESLSRIAIRFALMKPEVSTVLVGFSNLSQIEEAVPCSGAGGLPEEAMARLRKLWQTDFGRLG